MGPTFGGINLEDIKAPECFIIEQRLKEEMDIPVFHDDQHGTAVICAAGLINALHISGKKIEDVRIVLNGAGAAGIACLELLKAMGAKHDQLHHVRHQGRDLSGPYRGHEPMEIGPCRAYRIAHLGRGDEGCRRVPGCFRQGCCHAGHGHQHGERPGDLRNGKSGPRDHARRRTGGSPRCHRRHGAVRLPQPGQQRPWISRTCSAVRWIFMPARSTTR